MARLNVRFLMRHRSAMVEDAAKQLQLMQKSLTEMNLKLQPVFSDIDGVSAQAIINAILAASVKCEVVGELPEAAKAQRVTGKNSLAFPVFELGWRFYGVDLSGVPGVSSGLIGTLISEIGTREQILSDFPYAGERPPKVISAPIGDAPVSCR